MFVGHTKDVLSVAFSADNRQIVSGSRDKTIKLWNTLGVCKYTIQVTSQRCSSVLSENHRHKIHSIVVFKIATCLSDPAPYKFVFKNCRDHF